jgi:hypothetical protein
MTTKANRLSNEAIGVIATYYIRAFGFLAEII